MSNEEMVAAIQKGDARLLEPLWDKVWRLVHTFAYRYYMATQGRGGVTVEDLEQTGYLAMVDAVSRYDATEAAFSTFLVLYLRKYFQEASGRRYKDKKGMVIPKDALDVSVSLNVSVGDEDETELINLIEDPTTQWENIDEQIWQEQMRDAVMEVLQDLPEQQVAAVRCRFWDQMTYEQAAGQLGCDANAVRGAENKAIRALRQPRYRSRLLPFYDFDYYGGTGFGSFRHSGMSVQERYLMAQEKTAI